MASIQTARLALTGEGASFAICRAQDDGVIGHANCRSESGEISIRIDEEFRGQGYGAEAAKTIIWYAFEELDLDVVAARPESGCATAIRLLTSLGFVRGADAWVLYHTDRLPGPEWNLTEIYRPEPMGEFFDARADGYDAHMFSGGGGEAYAKLGACMPKTEEAIEILDVGCGTGIELDYIWQSSPNARITCVDLSRGMLDLLLKNHAEKRAQIAALEASYVTWDYPEAAFDIALSSQTMHHFWEEEKVGIYRKIWSSLKNGGAYIESDFIVDGLCAEQYRRRYGIIVSGLGEPPKAGEYHIDLPFTIEIQARLLREAGFRDVAVLSDDVKPRWSGAILKAVK